MKHKSVLLMAFLIFFIIPGFAQEQPFYFMMLADPQLGIATANKDFTQETANYEFAVATVNRLKPSFVVLLGDLVNKGGDADQIREFQRISQKIDKSIPAYFVAGNHDVGRTPTPETLAAYRKIFGPDYFSFRAGLVYGIVLDSNLIIDPQKAEAEYQEQTSWLKKELDKAKESGAKHIVVFQHHPYFVNDVKEPEQTWNIPLARRQQMLSLFHSYNVHYIFAGHVHKSGAAKDGDLAMITVGSVGMPFGEDGSGLMAAKVTESEVKYHYFDFGRMSNKLDIK